MKKGITVKKVTRDKLLTAIAVIILPGGIPVYLGYKVYQMYKGKEEDKGDQGANVDDGQSEIKSDEAL